MKVRFVAFDPPSNAFTVFLSDRENKHGLPIQIGPFEANNIALKLKKIRSRRPLTHDLLHNILKAFNSEISKVEVMDFRENTYYAMIHLKANEREITMDSRPSDAIAIALAARAPIYVTEEVLSKAKTVFLDQLEEWLKSLNPEDFWCKA